MTRDATDEPPLLLDGARSLQYAILGAKPSERFSVVVDGLPLDMNAVSRIVIAEELVEGGVFLMHCNGDWATVAAGQYPDARSAQAAADHAYAGLPLEWVPFHDLSPDEEREVEITRSFLRELAADYPNEEAR